MANFCVGEERRLGKALPQHKLMQNLLKDNLGRPKSVKITKATQTDTRRAVSETNCCCGKRRVKELKKDSAVVGTLVKRVDEVVENRRKDEGYKNLLASIRERVAMNKKEEKEEECCSCSDGWSDNSTNNEPSQVNFPKETRNAMSLLLLKDLQSSQKSVSKFTKPCIWPGFVERMDHEHDQGPNLNPKLNSSESAAKIKPKLSKNKLDMN